MENTWLYFVASLVYMLPTLISFQKKNLIQVFLMNFFVGFTIIGWIIAFIMALKLDNPIQKTAEQNTVPEPQEPFKEELEKARDLYNKGFLSLNEVYKIESTIEKEHKKLNKK